MAATGVGRPFMRGKLPGANDQEWRIASGNAYGGNSIAVPAAPPVTLPTTLRRNVDDDDVIRRTGGVTQGSLRRNLEDNDVIRRT